MADQKQTNILYKLYLKYTFPHSTSARTTEKNSIFLVLQLKFIDSRCFELL